MIMWAAQLRRLPFWLLPALALLALAAALLWLTPAEPAQAQDGSAATITTGPVITSSPASGDTYGKGETITVTLTFSKSVTVTGEPRVRLAMGERKRWARYSGGSGGATLTFAYKVKGNDRDDDGISISKNAVKTNGGSMEDADGNAARLKHPALDAQSGHKVNGSPPEPAITAGPFITSSPASGDTYRAGETITVTVTFSEAVTVNGEPRVRMDVGERKRWARYSGGSGGATLTFAYTVKKVDADGDGVSIPKNAVQLNGGSIADADGNAAVLSHSALAAQSGHKVEGSPQEPTITAGPVITSSPASGDTYRAGETITVTVTFSESVTVTGEPRVRLEVGERKRYARYSSADDATLTFAYTVRRNVDADEDGVSIPKNAVQRNGGTIADGDGNAAKLKHPALADQAGHKVAGSPEEAPAEPEPTPTPTPEPANSEPQFAAESATRSVPENTPKGIRVGDAIAAVGGGGAPAYKLGGADAGAFKIDAATGQLRFLKTPDYEKPADAASTMPANAAGNNQYVVTVSVSDGKDSEGNTEATPAVDDSINVNIMVTNVDERGRLTLSPTRPRLGAAVTATLSDPDGRKGAPTWKWERSTSRTSWSVIPGATSASYTPTAADAGTFLRATATYADGFGTGKQVRATASEVTLAHTLSALSVTTTAAKEMYPTFDPATLHYAVGCQVAPANEGDPPTDAELTVTLSAQNASTRVAVNGIQRANSDATFKLTPGATGEVRITLSGSAGAATTYVVHCIDNNIPPITTTKTAGAQGIIEDLIMFARHPSVVIIDNNGVPRWYDNALSAPRGLGPFFRVFEQPDGSRRYFYSTATSVEATGTNGQVWHMLGDDLTELAKITTVDPLTATDHHDILLMDDGNYVMFSYEPAQRDFSFLTTTYGIKKHPESAGDAKRRAALRRGESGYDAGVALSSTEQTADSVIQIRKPGAARTNDQEVWRWNSWGYLPLEDCVANPTPSIFPSSSPHINSVELLEDGDFIASFRGCSTVARIDRQTKGIVWRLGRSNLTDEQWKARDEALSGAGTPPLTILDDPHGEFCGQHAAYLLENGNLFVFDNGVACVEDPATGATQRTNNVFSRAIEYALDPDNGEAVFQRHHSLHSQFKHLGYWGGHIEELDNGDWLIGWGGTNQWARSNFSLPDSALTPDHWVTQVDPRTNQEKFSIKLGPEDQVLDLRPIPLSPVALAPKSLPLAAKVASAGINSASHSGASDEAKVVVAFNQPVVDFLKTTPSISVTGATVKSVSPYVEAGVEANAYVFVLTPQGAGQISFSLSAKKPCGGSSGGVCTASGGQLTAWSGAAHVIPYVAPATP